MFCLYADFIISLLSCTSNHLHCRSGLRPGSKHDHELSLNIKMWDIQSVLNTISAMNEISCPKYSHLIGQGQVMLSYLHVQHKQKT